jgi:hypothetical protein
MKILITILLFTCSGQAFAWGFFAHRLINEHAVYLLPPQMMVLYKPNIYYLSEHAVDPDKRRYVVNEEGPRHYIDMDKYDVEWLRSRNITWKKALERYPEDSLLAHGIVPWWIQTMLHRLTDGFIQMNITKILRTSAELAHYISDAHVPLHTSSNHNGQFTNQHGIHGFWESRVPELAAEKEWDLWPGKARWIRDPLNYTWNIVFESANATDSVLSFERLLNDKYVKGSKYAFENRNGLLVKQYSSGYTRAYEKLLNGMVERRFMQSVEAVACFWYTAWVNAGQPDCSKLLKNPLPDSEKSELEALNMKWREGKIKGKACD